MPVRITDTRHFNTPTPDRLVAAAAVDGLGAALDPAVAITATAEASTGAGAAPDALYRGGAKAGTGTVNATGAAYDATVTTTGETAFMVGAACGGTTIATEQSRVGASLDLHRVFDSGFSTNFMSSAGAQDVTDGIVTIYSFKPSIVTLAAGTTLNGQINTLLGSIPAGHPCALCIWHEPENDTAGTHGGASPTGWTYQQYRDAYARFADLVHATGRAELKTIWILMAGSWKLSLNRDPDLWYPGDAYVDMVGVDSYNEGSLKATQRWDSPGFGLGEPDPTESLSPAGGGYVDGGFTTWVGVRNKPWIWTEMGTIRRLSGTRPQWSINNGVPWTKAGWLAYGAELMAAQPLCIGASYFDTGGRTWAGTPAESWQLGNDTGGADYAAWAAAAQTYGYRQNGKAVPW